MTQPTVFITGISRGIGASLASHYLADGWRVYGCATTDAAPDGARGFACDLSDEASVAAVFTELADERVRLDCLINNAGILGPRETIQNTTLAEWRRVFAVNVDGPFNIARHADPLLDDGATVINLSSSVGRKGRGEWGAYACSKHALEGLTDVLADELRNRRITVVSFNPGGTATDMRAEAFPDEDPETLPTADAIARIIFEQSKQLTPEDSGAKLNCRDFL